MKHNINLKRTWKLINSPSILMCSLLFLPSINYFINLALQSAFGKNVSVSSIFYVAIYLSSLVSYIKYFGTDFKYKIVIFLLLIAALFSTIISYLIYVNVRKQIFTSFLDAAYNPTYRFLALSFPLIFLPLLIKDFQQTIIQILRISKFTIVVALLSYIITFAYGKNDIFIGSSAYMSFSYHILFSICVIFSMQKNRIVNILGVIACFTVIVSGARGALICILVYFIYRLFNVKKLTFKHILILLTVLLIVIYIIEKKYVILSNIQIFLKTHGWNSRTLDTLANDTFSNYTAREDLNEQIIDGIKKWPFGYGLWGDRYLCGSYCHNVMLEIMSSFGIVVGSILFASIIYKITKKLIFDNKNSPYYMLLESVFSVGFSKIFLSSSMLLEPYFFLMISLIFFINTKKKKEEIC